MYINGRGWYCPFKRQNVGLGFDWLKHWVLMCGVYQTLCSLTLLVFLFFFFKGIERGERFELDFGRQIISSPIEYTNHVNHLLEFWFSKIMYINNLFFYHRSYNIREKNWQGNKWQWQ